jgi:hypothetical protein
VRQSAKFLLGTLLGCIQDCASGHFEFVIRITEFFSTSAILIFMQIATAMDAKYCREKSDLCLRIADGLSLNNPGKFKLMELAEDFLQRAKELEAQESEQRQSNSR